MQLIAMAHKDGKRYLGLLSRLNLLPVVAAAAAWTRPGSLRMLHAITVRNASNRTSQSRSHPQEAAQGHVWHAGKADGNARLVPCRRRACVQVLASLSASSAWPLRRRQTSSHKYSPTYLSGAPTCADHTVPLCATVNARLKDLSR